MSDKTIPISRGLFDDPAMDEALDSLVAQGLFPSFDEFRKNPDKWRERPDALFSSIDRSMISNRKDLGKQKVFWRDGKESFTLEKLEGVCKDHGYGLHEIDMIPFRLANSTGTGRDEILVRVYPKWELQQMGAVMPNA